MMKKVGAAVLVMLFLGLPSVAAQATTLSETFEGETLGAAPSTDWGTWTNPGTITTGISGEGGSRALASSQSGANPLPSDTMTLTPTDAPFSATDFSAWFSADGSANQANSIRVANEVGGTVFDTTIDWLDREVRVNGYGGVVCVASARTIKVEAVFNWGPQTVDLVVKNSNLSTCYSATISMVSSSNGIGFMSATASPSFSSTSSKITLDDFSFDGITYAPTAPEGVSAFVEKGGSTSISGRVVVSWLLSSSDPDQSVGVHDYDVYVNGSFHATDPITAEDGSGSRSYDFYFTGATSFGERTFEIKAKSGGLESDLSCSVVVDLDVLGDAAACGSSFVVGAGEPAEFDDGLDDTIESFGFVSAESKMFFVLFMVGGLTVATGASMKLVAPSKIKNYVLMGVGAGVGIFSIITEYLEVWIFILALLIAIFAIKGGGEVRNTFFEVQAAIKQRLRPTVLDAEVQGSGFNAEGVNVERFDESVKALEAAETAELSTSEASEDTDGGDEA